MKKLLLLFALLVSLTINARGFSSSSSCHSSFSSSRGSSIGRGTSISRASSISGHGWARSTSKINTSGVSYGSKVKSFRSTPCHSTTKTSSRCIKFNNSSAHPVYITKHEQVILHNRSSNFLLYYFLFKSLSGDKHKCDSIYNKKKDKVKESKHKVIYQ